jgi:KEOPS complex subunit Cgi121
LKALPLRCKTPPGIEALEKYRDVQLMDPRYIAGEEHLKSAILQAERAFKRKENISTTPFIEVLVRASLNRQIKNAFELFGPKGSNEVVAISKKYPKKLAEEYGCTEDESVLEVDEKKYEKIKEKFDIAEKEIMAVSGSEFEDRVKTLQKIIAERMALLNNV